MRKFMTAGLLAGLALAHPAYSQDAAYDAATILATVNGTEITLGNVIVMRDRLPEQYRNMPDDVLLSGIIEQLVDQTLLADIASKSAETDPLEVKLHLENERRGTLAGRVAQERMAEPLDDAAVQAAYDKSVADFKPQPEFNAAHILVATEDEAKKLLAEIEGGADFAELAKANSSDGSAQNGGGLGWFSVGQMVPEFETAVVALEPGAVAGPVQTQFGWHLIKLTEKRETSAPPLEEMRPEIEAQLRQQALQAELAELRAAATIEMAEPGLPPAAIRESDLVRN